MYPNLHHQSYHIHEFGICLFQCINIKKSGTYEDAQIQFIMQTNYKHTRLNKTSLGIKKKCMSEGEDSSDQM